MTRFSIRPDPEGWTVFDVWTGLPAEIDGVPQIGLEMEAADDLADALSARPSLAD